MKIEYRNKALMINYRFPWEFVFIAWKLRIAIMLWVIHWWVEGMKDLWNDKGFRILGIEIVLRKYK